MSSSSSRPSGQNGGLLPPHERGGGRGGRGSGDSMPNYGERLRRARLGLAVAMAPIIMLFLSFSIAYIIRRGYPSFEASSNALARTWVPVHLPWSILWVNTAVLIFSSLTMEFARRDITRQSALAPIKSIPGVSLGDERHLPWLQLTTGLGFAFLCGQLFLWTQLSSHGSHFYDGPSGSFVFFLTGMHALHLAGGTLALLLANLYTILGRPVESRRILVDVTAWYWHFMAGIWIYILALLFFFAW